MLTVAHVDHNRVDRSEKSSSIQYSERARLHVIKDFGGRNLGFGDPSSGRLGGMLSLFEGVSMHGLYRDIRFGSEFRIRSRIPGC